MLLDTHTFLWFVLDDPQLGGRARQAIRDADVVYVSAVTVTEIIIKQMLGKLPQNISVADGAEQSGFSMLPYDAEHAAALQEFASLARHDPFDRMLAAQAYNMGITLITTDAVLLGLNALHTLNARH